MRFVQQVGDDVTDIEQQPYKGHWAEVVLHAEQEGKFAALKIGDEYKSHVVETDLWVSKGDPVHAFVGANDAIGTLVVKFDTKESLISAMSDICKWVTVKVEKK